MSRQHRHAGASRRRATASTKSARSGVKTQSKKEDFRLKRNPKSIAREFVLLLTGAAKQTLSLPDNCHDLLFKIILFTPECIKILLRMALPKELVERINFDIDPIYLDRVHDEWGNPKAELDGVILLHLYSGLYLLITLEHRSFYHNRTQFQIRYNTFRVWNKIFGLYGFGKAELPETHALVVLHGPGADHHPPSMQELCGIACEDPQSSFCASPVTLFDGRNATIEDFGPAIHGGILYAMFHSHELPVCDAGVRYLVEAVATSPSGSAIAAYIYEWLDITNDRWHAALSAHPQAKQTEETMGPLALAVRQDGVKEGEARGLARGEAKGLARGKAEGLARGEAKGLARGKAEGLARGKAEGLAQAFLVLARKNFGKLSRAHTALVMSASPEELNAWFNRLASGQHPNEIFDSEVPCQQREPT